MAEHEVAAFLAARVQIDLSWRPWRVYTLRPGSSWSAVCCSYVGAESSQILNIAVVLLSTSFSFVAARHVFGSSNLVNLSAVMCVSGGILALTCSRRNSFSLRFLQGSASVLVISRSVAFPAGHEATSAPLTLTCQPTKLQMDSLKALCHHRTGTKTHTEPLFIHLGVWPLICGGFASIIGTAASVQPAEVYHRLLSRV